MKFTRRLWLPITYNINDTLTYDNKKYKVVTSHSYKLISSVCTKRWYARVLEVSNG